MELSLADDIPIEQLLEPELEAEDSPYWAHADAADIGGEIMARVEAFDEYLESSGRLEKWKRVWRYYYGRFRDGWSNSGLGLQRVGENGEMLFFGVNHLRSVLKSIHGLATQNPPSFEISSTNTDARSNQMASLSKVVLDYYISHKKVREFLHRGAEHCLIFDAGYLLMEWSPLLGREFGERLDTAGVAPAGDVDISNPLALDVIFDPYIEQFHQRQWTIIRQWVNRFDLLELHRDDPELVEKIRNAQTKEDSTWRGDRSFRTLRFGAMADDGLNDDILLYKFFHKKSEAIPEGRLVAILDGGELLSDTHLPYPEIPLERMVADEEIGGPFGYAPANNLLALQESLNVVNSSIITQHYTHGVSIIASQEGTDLNPRDLGRGMILVTYGRNSNPPQAVNFTSVSPDAYKFRDEIVRDMERVPGISEVNRGQAPKNLESGASLALIASMTAQNQGPFQQSYSAFAGAAATTLLRILRDFVGAGPRTLSIMGKHNSARTSFTGDDLVDFDRVLCELGNPLTQTFAGRMQVAQDLLQQGVITADEYFEVLASGNIENATESRREEYNFVRLENEKLMDGASAYSHPEDNHELHLMTHRELLMREALRYPQNDQDVAIRQAVENHLLEHQAAMQQLGPPAGGPPGAPPGGPPGAGPPAGPPAGPQPPQGGEPTAEELGIVSPTNPMVGAAAAAGTRMPQMPNDPRSGENFVPGA